MTVASKDDPQGSTWRRWDFQVHTPASHLNNQFGSDWDVYVEKLFRTAIERELAVIGITDYFTIDGYKLIKEEYLSDDAKLSSLFSREEIDKIRAIRLLPNIEFRLSKLVGGNRVNAHVIMSDEVSIRDIEENFLHDLSFTHEAEPQATATKRKLKVENLRELGEKLMREHEKFREKPSALHVGMMNAVVDDDAIHECLSDRERFKDKYLFCVVADEDLPRLPWDGQDHQTRKVLVQRSDALFSGNPKTRSWALALPPYTDGEQHFLREFITLKPCLHGSDAHGYSEIGHPCALRGKASHTCDPENPDQCELRFCWIKGDTTFEGLRQVIHEPSDRAFIGPTAPDYHDQARVITSVSLSDGQGWFEDVEVPLNAGMVSIIGQKGSGKSALADLIAYAGGDWIEDDPTCFLRRANPYLDGMSVTLQWAEGVPTSAHIGRGQHPEKLVRYLSQDYVERICARDGITRELVREIENVIFSYLDPTDTLNASDFAELRTIKTAGIVEESGRLKNVIGTIIRHEFALRDLIAKLPEKEARLKTLAAEKDGLTKQLPAPASAAEAQLLQDLQAKRSALTEVQKAAAGEKQNLQRVDDLRKRVDAFRAQIDRYFEDLVPALRDAGIPETDWPKFKPAFVSDYRVPLTERTAAIQLELAKIEGGDPPSAGTVKRLILDIEELSKNETADKARQERTKQIQMRIAAIDAEAARLQAEIKQINDVDKPRLNGVQTRRLDAYRDYFSNLALEKAVLQSLYDPIRGQLNERALLQGKDLEFSIRWIADLNRWLERGEALFDQRKAGPYGSFSELSESARKILVPAWTSGDAEKTRAALDRFLEAFRGDLAPSAYLRTNATTKDLMAWLFEVDHIRLDYGLKFGGGDLESLSPGTKGIVLLILYLGMDVNDTRPLIVDQPDENLDNESIYNLLTPYFRAAKVRRQVIVITHNPNLVVNSDSEQIVVAAAEKQSTGLPSIRYVSGAMENAAVRQQVCNILEGGNEAFLKRDRRYAIPRRT